MNEHRFGEVTAYEVGFAPVGRPFMTVYFYTVGGLMVDTGLSHLRREVLGLVRTRPPRAMALTHYHEDHSGNAGALQAELGVPVYGHPLTARQLSQPYLMFPYRHLVWGRPAFVRVSPLPDLVTDGDLALTPLHTPGHSPDHTVFLEARRGWLFSGDLYLADRVKYTRVEERLDDEIASIRRVLALDFDALFCSHRPHPHGGKARLAAKLQHLEDLYGSVAALWARGYSEGAIMRRLGLKEQWPVRLMCMGDVSAKNMVRSVIQAERRAAGRPASEEEKPLA